MNSNIIYKSVFINPNIWLRRFIKYLVRIIPARYLYSYAIKEKYDTEVAFLENISTKVIAGSTSKAKKIAWIHADIKNYPSTRKLFVTRKNLIKSYENMDKIICVSEHAKEVFTEYTSIKDKVVTIYNPINQEEIMDKATANVDNIFSDPCFTICSVGRLSIEKGYDRLLKVTKKLNEENNVNLFVIGEGEEREKLQDYIKENRLEEKVKLLGFKKNPYSYMKQCDLFISTSLSEGFSLVLAEAIVLEIPIISTNTAGASELLQEGRYGLLVENTEEAIYDGIKKVIENVKEYKTLKEKVKERKKFFKLEEVISKIEEIL